MSDIAAARVATQRKFAPCGNYEIASVRFHGLIRETSEGNPEPFDEVWHVRKKRTEARAPWLIAGIQQAN